jgi:hypothetical protein
MQKPQDLGGRGLEQPRPKTAACRRCKARLQRCPHRLEGNLLYSVLRRCIEPKATATSLPLACH